MAINKFVQPTSHVRHTESIYALREKTFAEEPLVEENSGNSNCGIEVSTTEVPKKIVRHAQYGTRKQRNKHHRGANKICGAIQNFSLLL